MSDGTTDALKEQSQEHSDHVDEVLADIREKIKHVLETYPYLSRGMIQQGLGPGTQPKLWDPVLEGLVADGEVKKVETVVAGTSGRALTKVIYHLPKYPYPPVKTPELEHLTR